MKRIIYVIAGLIGLVFSVIGAIVPLLPAFPFILLTVFCFGKSSKRLHKWFIGTKLYKNNLDSYIKGQGMLTRTKIKIITSVTITMAIGFVMMSRIQVGRIILSVVWIAHVLYFSFGVKTLKPKELEYKMQLATKPKR